MVQFSSPFMESGSGMTYEPYDVYKDLDMNTGYYIYVFSDGVNRFTKPTYHDVFVFMLELRSIEDNLAYKIFFNKVLQVTYIGQNSAANYMLEELYAMLEEE